MQFNCNKSVILKEISVAQEIISSRNAISILSNVLMETDDDTLIIKATDLKISFETRIPVIVEEKGLTTVLCDKLLEILRNLPDGDVQFICNDDDGLVVKTGENIKFNLRSISAYNFPEFPSSSEEEFFSIAQKEFISMINHSLFAISEDEARYNLNGVYICKDEDKLFTVGTDSRRLSYASITPNAGFPDFKGAIIPPKILTVVKKLASGEGEFKIAVSDKYVFIHFDNQFLASTIIEANFPNYKKAIPTSYENEIIINRTELLDGVRRVSLMSDKKSKKIRISLTTEAIILNSDRNEAGGAKEIIKGKFDVPTTNFLLNFAYVLDPLRAIDGDKICIKFNNNKTTITIVSVPESNAAHHIMPMD